jgi:hypothetical protein
MFAFYRINALKSILKYKSAKKSSYEYKSAKKSSYAFKIRSASFKSSIEFTLVYASHM